MVGNAMGLQGNPSVEAVGQRMVNDAAKVVIAMPSQGNFKVSDSFTTSMFEDYKENAIAAFGKAEFEENCGSCYDAASTYVLKWNLDTKSIEKVLAIDVEPGDRILGKSLVPEEVLIKNVQRPKITFMRTITAVTVDGSTFSMTLSAGHRVPVQRAEGKCSTLIPCRDLSIGDIVSVVMEDHSCQYASISHLELTMVEKTVSLRTRSLTLVVNGFVGSSRAEGDAGTLGHLLILVASAVVKNGGQKLQNLAWALNAKLRTTQLLNKYRMMLL